MSEKIEKADLYGDGIERISKFIPEVFNSFYDGIWICDGEGSVLYINKAAESINNVEAKHVLKKNMAELVSQGLADRSVTLEVIRNKSPVTIIRTLKNGKKVLATGVPVFDEVGHIHFVVVNIRDINELMGLRDELEKNRARSDDVQVEWAMPGGQDHPTATVRAHISSTALSK